MRAFWHEKSELKKRSENKAEHARRIEREKNDGKSEKFNGFKNFGFNFSFWDRMLGTYLEAPEGSQESLVLGIDGFTGKTTRTIPALLKQPLLAPSIDEQ